MLVTRCIVFAFCLMSLSEAQTQQADCLVAGDMVGDPSDCTKYISCSSVGTGFVMSCSFPTYFDPKLLACVPDKKSPNCTMFCESSADTRRPGKGHCRGYWECQGKEALPMCCPEGQRYNGTLNLCEDVPMDDPNPCNVACLNNFVKNETVVEKCNSTAIQDDTSAYTVTVEGFPTPIKMLCPIGTEFDQAECDCVVKDTTAPVEQNICIPELLLEFINGTEDSSPKHISGQVTNVHVTNGVAVFNGNNSMIVFSRFTNVEHLEKLVMDIKYTSDHSNLPGNQSIISNDNCEGDKPSIVILEDRINVYFLLGLIDANNGYSVATLAVSQPVDTSEKIIKLELLDGMMSATVNGVTKSVQATGFLENTHCALSIGESAKADPLQADIDYVRIHFCVPKPK